MTINPAGNGTIAQNSAERAALSNVAAPTRPLRDASIRSWLLRAVPTASFSWNNRKFLPCYKRHCVSESGTNLIPKN
jgi:hypothetical protein